MPKTEKTVRDPWSPWRGMVLEAQKRRGMTLGEIAERLQHRTYGGAGHPSRQMVSRWINNPDCMPMWAFAALNRILEIEASAAREAAVVWR